MQASACLPTPLNVTTAITAAIQQVLRDTARESRAIEPAMLLSADIGLDSLDLAQTIVLLERSLGVDPFRSLDPAIPRPSIRTVSDLIAIYSTASSQP
jgi:acyl carrier protein